MTLDHIMPQTLLDDPEHKKQIFSEYGLPEDFNIESYNNWIPCHQCENRQKGDTLFPKANALYFISVASGRTEDANRIEEYWRTAKRNDKLLYQLNAGLRSGVISTDQVNHIVVEYQQKIRDETSVEVYAEDTLEVPNEPVVIAFGITVDTVHEQEMYDEELLDDYPRLCDQLQADLMGQLSSIVSCKIFVCEDQRDGESLSVRIAFENPNVDEIYSIDSGPWEILEVRWYSEIYSED